MNNDDVCPRCGAASIGVQTYECGSSRDVASSRFDQTDYCRIGELERVLKQVSEHAREIAALVAKARPPW